MHAKHEWPVAAVIALSLTCLVTTACEQPLTGPALPATTVPRPTATSGLYWPITWSWVGAGPAGNCMADRLNEDMARITFWPPFTVRVQHEGSAISFHFNPHLEDDVGYLPGFYSGQVSDDGQVEARAVSLGDAPFVDPYYPGANPRCYHSWEWPEGRLTATISADGSITGTVEDTFRAVPSGGVFTVKTTFATRPPG